VRARRPDIIYCSMNAFGQIGPYAARPGHEQLAQALTGMQMRYGGGKPAIAPYSANDYGTGLLGCYAVALALLHRRRTGEGQHVDSALAYAATMLQSGLLLDHAAQKWDEPAGQHLLGERPLYRAYQAADGWLFLAARPEDLPRCAALADLAGLEGAALERALEDRLRGQNVAQWVQRLTQAGLGAHRVAITFAEVMGDATARARGLSMTREHDEIGPVTTIGPAPRLSRTPVAAGRPAPKPGSDAASVLAEIGMAAELERLVRDKIVAVDGVNPDTGKRS
jgi:crotonobetainyl-CoA:carnitine CoA-transferase CaiB-like acyl-CoA transferase